MADLVRLKQKVRPLKTRYFPDAPYTVKREDQDDGTIIYEIHDMRPDSFRTVCSTSDFEGDNPLAKYDAEQIARALNMMVQFGKETLPPIKDEDL